MVTKAEADVAFAFLESRVSGHYETCEGCCWKPEDASQNCWRTQLRIRDGALLCWKEVKP